MKHRKTSFVSLLDYQNGYSNNAKCEETIFRNKWPDGFRCSKCGCKKYYIIQGRKLKLYQCKSCGHQNSVIQGTIMENSKMDLPKWFMAAYFMAQNKNSVSGSSLAQYIGTTIKTAQGILKKFRSAMGSRDALYQLTGTVEVDETMYGAPDIGGKRGRGADKVKIEAALQLNSGIYPTYIKLRVIPDFAGVTINGFAEANIAKGSVVKSDGLPSYNGLSEKGYELIKDNFNPHDESKHLIWLHTCISNLKSMIDGTFHGLGKKYIQGYLDEFCYRFNRRHSKEPLVFHLLRAAVTQPYHTLAELCI